MDTHRQDPIVPDARFMVTCECGYAHDSAARTAEEAVKEVAAMHQAGHRLEAEAVDYTEHPLYHGRHGNQIRREKIMKEKGHG